MTQIVLGPVQRQKVKRDAAIVAEYKKKRRKGNSKMVTYLALSQIYGISWQSIRIIILKNEKHEKEQCDRLSGDKIDRHD